MISFYSLDLEMNFKLFLNCLDNNVTNKKSLDQFQVDTCNTLRITIIYYLSTFSKNFITCFILFQPLKIGSDL